MLEFTPQAFKAFYEEFSGQDLPDHCLQWVQEFIDHRNLMLNVPPRHMKSTIFSCWVPIWLLTINRDEQIIIVSKTNALAVRWASDIANQLEFNNHLTSVFGRFAPERKGDSPWRPGRGELLVLGRNRESRGMQLSVLARGSGQQILGMEATVVIADDPTDAGIARSEVENDRQLNWLREEVLSRVENPVRGGAAGRAVIVGQRVHFRDLYGRIAEQTYERGAKIGEQLWKVIVHKAVQRWPDEDSENPEPIVLWPEVWPFEELMVQYERVGGYKQFYTMFQQDPLPEEARIVKPEWWEACRQYDRSGGHGVRETDDRAFLPVSRVVSFDPSPRNYNGLIVADITYDREWFRASIIEADHFIGNLGEILERLDSTITKYSPDYLIIEFSTFAHWMEEDPIYQRMKQRVKIMPHSTGKNKNDPELGVESLAGDIEGGRILLPYGDKWGKDMSALFEGEINVWPYGNHDDVLMALWFIKCNYRRLVPTSAYRGEQAASARTPPRLAGGFSWARKAQQDSFGANLRSKMWPNRQQ